MIEVRPGLFVGSQEDFSELYVASAPDADEAWPGWAIVHAAKEPFHRSFVGYTGKAAPKDHPEYLFARRGWRLALNLVDVAYPEYVRPELVFEAMAFVATAHLCDRKVLIHCNQGGSRAPSLALHWLRRNDPRFVSTGQDITPLTFDVGEAIMRAIYPLYKPAEGIRGFVRENWDKS